MVKANSNTHKLTRIITKKTQTNYMLHFVYVTSHAFTPPPSEYGCDVVIISYHGRCFGLIVVSGARLGVSSGRISHGWVNGSSSERVGMRHEFGFQFEFRQLFEFGR